MSTFFSDEGLLLFQGLWWKILSKRKKYRALGKCEHSISKRNIKCAEGERETYSVQTLLIRPHTHTHTHTKSIRTEGCRAVLYFRPDIMRAEEVNPHQSENPINTVHLIRRGRRSLKLASDLLATDTPLTLLTRYSKAPKCAAANRPRGSAAPRRGGGCCSGLKAQIRTWWSRSGHIVTNKASDLLCRSTHTYAHTHSFHSLTCIAPMFSISCSVLDAPRRTELTPSFRRHHAAGNQ